MNLKPTDEQEKIINEVFQNNITLVNAFAGTGKTTTCMLILKESEKRKYNRACYLVFNKAMQIESEKKIQEIGIKNTEVKTVHALAYKYLARTGYLKNKNIGNIRTMDIANFFDTHNFDRCYFLLKIFNEFLYSEYSIEEVEQFFESLSKNQFYKKIVEQYQLNPNEIKKIYNAIEQNNLYCPHDFYLKKFIELLKKRQIHHGYDILILDESQDANPCFASLLKSMETKHLLMVGDKHQWIYSFRGSVNLMEKFDNIKKLYLTKTFRFDDTIAQYANIILQAKGEKNIIKTQKQKQAKKESAIISRTNSALLEFYIHLNENEKKLVFFERGIEEIAKTAITISAIMKNLSLYDLKEICTEKRINFSVIDETLFRLFRDSFELRIYIQDIQKQQNEQNENEASTESDIISAYKLSEKYSLNSLFKIVEEYKKYENENQKRLFLSTAHSSKGQEYQKVLLLDDFSHFLPNGNNKKKISTQEINLLYVACTRASEKILIPPSVANTIQSLSNPHR